MIDLPYSTGLTPPCAWQAWILRIFLLYLQFPEESPNSKSLREKESGIGATLHSDFIWHRLRGLHCFFRQDLPRHARGPAQAGSPAMLRQAWLFGIFWSLTEGTEIVIEPRLNK